MMTIAKAVVRRSTPSVPRVFVIFAVKRLPPPVPMADVRDIPTIRMPRIEIEAMMPQGAQR